VGNRKALLIGADDYGEGFAPLPAVRHDVELMRAALEASGYEVEICRDEIVSNAGRLDEAMRGFCKSGGKDDIRILYFTGHGLLAENSDCIVPAGTSREGARVSPNQRVATDLSKTVAVSDVGLVLFIIDACRDKIEATVTKGAQGWADLLRIDRPSEHRFIRFFGCAANEVCQVLPSAPGEKPASLFTKALTDSLLKADYLSIDDLLKPVTQRCEELSSANMQLQSQTPYLSYGEKSLEEQKVLKIPIFDKAGAATVPLVWQDFDPDKLHCLVMQSEKFQSEPARGLTGLVRNAAAGRTGERIWKSFYAACHGRRLTSGATRNIPEKFDPSRLELRCFSVLDALASTEALDKALRAVVEADLVVFDVTGFEPGIMLFVGIRSATRKAITICSHGTWKEGESIEMPFNLQDLNINSHAQSETRAGPNPVVERFVHRVETGFYQLSRHPGYLDLPAYDALRQLGPQLNASSTITLNDRVLVLCSYSDSYFDNWMEVAWGLKVALSKKGEGNILPEIERIIDYGSPQLIWQSLYEQIRRTAACVVDWSEYSPSVFLELGVRLAVSAWGAVQIVDERYLPEKATKPGKQEIKAKSVKPGKPQPAQPKKTASAQLQPTDWSELTAQIERLKRLFEPIPYQCGAALPAAFDKAVDELMRRRPILSERVEYNRIHRTLMPIIATIQEAHSPVYEQLKDLADSIHHPDQDRQAIPQLIFSGSRANKLDSKKSALEMRIAAWLYLEHRTGAGKLPEDSDQRIMHDDLARSAQDALYDLINEASIDSADYAGALQFAKYIESRLKKTALKPPPDLFGQIKRLQEDARSSRKKGEALRKARDEKGACEAFATGAEILQAAIKHLEPQTPQAPADGGELSEKAKSIVNELVETYGARGGMLQRLGSLDQASESYAKGAVLERNFALPGTYNRVNAVKYSLLGGVARLRDLMPEIKDLAEFINASLGSEMSGSDSGWAWADLGDCMALLGEVDAARKAYSTFIAKAEIKSPERTLDILIKIAAKLEEKKDPDQGRLRSVIADLKSSLAGQ